MVPNTNVQIKEIWQTPSRVNPQKTIPDNQKTTVVQLLKIKEEKVLKLVGKKEPK